MAESTATRPGTSPRRGGEFVTGLEVPITDDNETPASPAAAPADRPLSDITDEELNGWDADDDEGDAGGEGDDDEGGDPDVRTADEEARTAALEAERVRIRQEERQRLEDERNEAAQAQAREQRTEQLKGSYSSTIANIGTALKNHVVTLQGPDGQLQVRLGDVLSDEALGQLVYSHLGTYNQSVFDAQALEVYGQLGKGAGAVLPKQDMEAFARDFAGKPVGEWLKGFGEAYAKHSDWGKEADADKTAAVKAAEARGVRRGKGMPPEQPTQQGTGGRAPRSTFAQLEAGYGAGTLNEAEEQEYVKQAKERGRFR